MPGSGSDRTIGPVQNIALTASNAPDETALHPTVLSGVGVGLVVGATVGVAVTVGDDVGTSTPPQPPPDGRAQVDGKGATVGLDVGDEDVHAATTRRMPIPRVALITAIVRAAGP